MDIVDLTTLAGGAGALVADLPPEVRKNFSKSVAMLVTGVFEIPAAWLDSKVQAIRDEKAARTRVAKGLATAVVARLPEHADVVERAVQYYSNQLMKSQTNRERVVVSAARQLHADPPKEDAKEEISEDWLNMFSRIAEQHSTEDFQGYFGSLLAGEIRKPGSFSAATVLVLSTLDTPTADLFRRLCDISTNAIDPDELSVIAEPYGQPGANSLEPLGFTYQKIATLADAGLVMPGTTATLGINADFLRQIIDVGGRPLQVSVGTSEESLRASCLMFTRAGRELRPMMRLTGNDAYIAIFRAWIEKMFSK